MNTKSPTRLLLSFAVVWASIAQPMAALAQANVRVQTNGAAVNVALPTLSIPSIGNLSALPGSVNLPELNRGGLPSLPGAIGASGQQLTPNAVSGRIEQALKQGGSAVQAPGLSFAKKGQAAQATGSQTPVETAPDGGQVPQGNFDGIGGTERTVSPNGPDAREEGNERQGGVSVFKRLTTFVMSKLSPSSIFDGSKSRAGMAPAGMMGILPLPKPTLPQGVDLDEAPVSPAPKQVGGVEIENVNIPGVRTIGGVFDAGPRVLTANTNSEADVERALRELVDQDAAKYGVTSAELATVHVKRVAGAGNQADTFYGYFRQQAQGTNPDGSPNRLAIHGTYLSFVVKVVAGKPILMSSMAKLYPTLGVDTRQRLSDDELKTQAVARLGLPPASGTQLEFVERKIIYAKSKQANGAVVSAWHAANLYVVQGLPFMIAIDIATGEAFAWDSRMGARMGSPVDDTATPTAPAPQAKAGGDFKGRVETDDKRPNGKINLSAEPLKFLKVTLADGRTVETDENGQIDVNVDKPTQATAVLAGRYAIINDQARRPLKVNVTLQPGQRATVVFNDKDNDEIARSQANTYVAVTRVRIWVGQKGINDKRLDNAIPVNVNIDDECNAYYTPGRPSLNFFKSSKNCSDTGKPGVVMHEWGHYLDDMIGGITNGGLSEGWGDTLSMYILNSPIIGEGFLKNRTPDYIRHGENLRPYSESDEVHDQGEVWMGFTWKLRKALIASLGAAAGAAAAESVVLPTLYSKAADIPSAIAQVLLNAMDKDGKIQYEKEIRAAAKAHAVDLPQNPGLGASLWAFLTAPLRGVKTVQSMISDIPATPSTGDGRLLSAGELAPALAQAGIRVSVGRLDSKAFTEEVARYAAYHGVKMTSVDNAGVFANRHQFVLTGPREKLEFIVSEINRIAQN